MTSSSSSSTPGSGSGTPASGSGTPASGSGAPASRGSPGIAPIRLVDSPPLDAVADLMQATWERPCWRYDVTLLRQYLERPSLRAVATDAGRARMPASLGAELGSRLVGFFAGIPIDVTRHGAVHPAIFTSFLSVDRAARDPMLALRLIRATLDAARAAGRMHVYTVFFEATGTLDAVQRMLHLAGCPMTELHDIHFLLCPAAILARRAHAGTGGVAAGSEVGSGGDAGDERVVPYAADLRPQVHALLERHAERLPLAQLIPEVDLDFMLTDSQAVTTRLWRTDGEVRGLITARVREVVHERTRTNQYLDLVVVDDLATEEQQQFVERTLTELAQPHVDAIVVPDTGAVPTALLRGTGFVQTPLRGQLAVGYLSDDAVRVTDVERSFFEVY